MELLTELWDEFLRKSLDLIQVGFAYDGVITSESDESSPRAGGREYALSMPL